MKYGKIFLLIAVILISILAINQFLLANCGQCGDKENPCSGQECKGKCTQCTDKEKCTQCTDKEKCAQCIDKEKSGSGQECKNEITLTGMFVCPCYLMMKDGETVDTAKAQECSVKCAEAGQPLLFVDDKGTIYMAMFCCKCNVPKKDAAAMAMDKITVKGCVCEKGGFKALGICSVEKIK
jgi:hypothetical protein